MTKREYRGEAGEEQATCYEAEGGMMLVIDCDGRATLDVREPLTLEQLALLGQLIGQVLDTRGGTATSANY